MSGSPLTAYLAHFSDRGRRNASQARAAPTGQGCDEAEGARRLQAAFADGERAGRDAERNLARQQIQEAEGRVSAQIEQARAQWAMELGGTLAEQFAAATFSARAEIEEAVAAILGPIVEQRQAARTIAAFAARTSAIVADKRATTITLRGPKDVIGKVAERLQAEDIRLDLVVADEPFVTAEIDETLVRARLHQVVQSLEERPDGG